LKFFLIIFASTVFAVVLHQVHHDSLMTLSTKAKSIIVTSGYFPSVAFVSLAVAISNVQAEESEFVDTLKIQRTVSVMCLPLLSGIQIMGAMYFDSAKRRYEFRREDVSFFSDLSHSIAVAIESIQFQLDMSRIAEKLSLDS
jgi:GAF domain-containing protein